MTTELNFVNGEAVVGLMALGMAKSVRTANPHAIQLCSMLALTTKAVAEGWEKDSRWTTHQLLSAYSRKYGDIRWEEWFLIICEVQKSSLFSPAFNYQNGVTYFSPNMGREMAVLMLDYCLNAKMVPTVTLNEAYEGK